MEDDHDCTYIQVGVRGKRDNTWKLEQCLLPRHVSHVYFSVSLPVWPKRSHFIFCSDSVSSPVTWGSLLIPTMGTSGREAKGVKQTVSVHVVFPSLPGERVNPQGTGSYS